MKIETYLCAISCLIVLALTYSVAAFIVWDVNPGNWSTFVRVVACFGWLSGSVLTVIAVVD